MALAAADRALACAQPPEIDTYEEPDATTAIALQAWRWLSSQRPPPALGFGGALHVPIPSYWVDYWLDRKAGLREGCRYWRLLEHLLGVMDTMYLERSNAPSTDDESAPKP